MALIDNRTILPTEILDLDDNTPNGMIYRLNVVASILGRMDARLSKIRDIVSDAPEPVRPQILAALNTVKTNADNVEVREAEVRRKLDSPR